MRNLVVVLFIFIGLHVLEILFGMYGVMAGELTFLRNNGDTLIDVMLIDIAISGLSFLALSVLAIYVMNERIAMPPNKRQLLLLSIFHFVSTLGVVAVVLMLVLSGNMTDWNV